MSLTHQNVSLITPGGDSALDETTNSVKVTIVGGAGSGGTSMTDDAAFVPGTGGITPAGGTYQATPDAVNDGDAGALRMSATRALYVTHETPAGDSMVDETNNALNVAIVAGGGSGGTSSNFGSAVPSAGTAAGFSDGTNMQAGRVFDGDSGAGTQYVLGTNLRKIASGGTAEAGTLADPLRTDPTGTTAQPITDNSGSLTVDNAVLSVVGGGVEATALRVTVASDSTGVLTVDGTVTANSGTNLNTSALALEAGGNLAAAAASLSVLDDWDETNRAAVNTIAGQVGVQGASGVVTALTQRVVLATDVALPTGTNGIGKLTANTGVDIGDVDVTSIVPGTGATNLGKAEDAAHTSGDVGVMALGVRAAAPTERSAGPTDGDYEPFATNEVGAVWVTPTPSANGGLTIFRSIDLDETEEEVKAAAGVLYGYYISNLHATSVRYVKFYNATAANVTVGTTTPVLTLPIPAAAAANQSFEHGIAFGTAICAAATTGVADNDTGAPGANEVVVNLFYK